MKTAIKVMATCGVDREKILQRLTISLAAGSAINSGSIHIIKTRKFQEISLDRK